jgi:serine/threonine protein kinase
VQKIHKKTLEREIEFDSIIWSGVSEEAKDFIMQCLQKDNTKRPLASMLKNHPWILKK